MVSPKALLSMRNVVAPTLEMDNQGYPVAHWLIDTASPPSCSNTNATPRDHKAFMDMLAAQ